MNFLSTLSFLDYIIESGRVRPDPEKIKAVVEWPKTHHLGLHSSYLNILPVCLSFFMYLNYLCDVIMFPDVSK